MSPAIQHCRAAQLLHRLSCLPKLSWMIDLSWSKSQGDGSSFRTEVNDRKVYAFYLKASIECDINNMPKGITAWWMRGYNADSFAFIVSWQFHSCQLFAKSLEWRTSRATWSNVGCFRALGLRNQESFLETRTRISEQKLMTQLKEDAMQGYLLIP